MVRKFLKFAKMDMKGAQAEAFVALEDWINDGVPLAAALLDSTQARVALGHIGMVVSEADRERAWKIMVDRLETKR